MVAQVAAWRAYANATNPLPGTPPPPLPRGLGADKAELDAPLPVPRHPFHSLKNPEYQFVHVPKSAKCETRVRH